MYGAQLSIELRRADDWACNEVNGTWRCYQRLAAVLAAEAALHSAASLTCIPSPLSLLHPFFPLPPSLYSILSGRCFECLSVAAQVLCASYLGMQDHASARAVLRRVAVISATIASAVGVALYLGRGHIARAFSRDPDIIFQAGLANYLEGCGSVCYSLRNATSTQCAPLQRYVQPQSCSPAPSCVAPHDSH